MINKIKFIAKNILFFPYVLLLLLNGVKIKGFLDYERYTSFLDTFLFLGE